MVLLYTTSLEVCEFLNIMLPDCWIGLFGNEDKSLLHWQPRSLDLTLCHFLLMGIVNDKTYYPSIHLNLLDLRQCITEAVEPIIREMLQSVWAELIGYFQIHIWHSYGAFLKQIEILVL